MVGNDTSKKRTVVGERNSWGIGCGSNSMRNDRFGGGVCGSSSDSLS